MDKKIIIIDYDIGNILSIKNAISHHGYNAIVTRDKKEIQSASHIILPGVGAFPAAMKKLQKFELIDPILEIKKNNNSYLLGICLGMQLLFSESEEFELTNGLNLINGKIKKLDKFCLNFNYKLPNIGWRNCIVDTNNKIKILEGISSIDKFYFVHSYGLKNFDKDINISESKYKDITFPAVINSQNIYGCQFHPEKSGPQGLKIIKNFLEL